MTNYLRNGWLSPLFGRVASPPPQSPASATLVSPVEAPADSTGDTPEPTCEEVAAAARLLLRNRTGTRDDFLHAVDELDTACGNSNVRKKAALRVALADINASLTLARAFGESA